MSAVRVGSIGLGWWGGMLAEKASLAGIDVAACFARTEVDREEFGRKYRARPAGSLDELLADPELDAVMIATPHSGMAGLGVHMADNLIYLLGRPTRVSAFSKKVIGVGRLDDVTTATIEIESGPLAFLGTAMVIPDIARTAVWGTEAAAWNENDGDHFYVQKVGEKNRTEHPIDNLDTVRDELEEFAANVRTGARPETGGHEAIEAVALLEGIVESAQTGRVIDLAEVRAR